MKWKPNAHYGREYPTWDGVTWKCSNCGALLVRPAGVLRAAFPDECPTCHSPNDEKEATNNG